MGTRWVTFDCFGTLVDWHTGFASALRPIAGDRVAELLAAYHRHEPAVETAERGLRVVSVMDARDGRPSGSVAEPFHATERAARGPPGWAGGAVRRLRDG